MTTRGFEAKPRWSTRVFRRFRKTFVVARHLAASSRSSNGFALIVAFAASVPLGLRAQEAPSPAPLAHDEANLFSSGYFLRLGFSFIVGLAVGYALKIAFKIVLVVGGLLLVLLFSLQYAGIVDINWTGMEYNYNGFVDWLAAYASALKGFMADNLSSAASFTTGLLLGLRL